MKKIIRLTESDLIKLVKRVINEQENDFFTKKGYTLGDFNTLPKSLVSNVQKNYPDYTKYYYKGNVKLITNGTHIKFLVAPEGVFELGPHPISKIQSNL